MATFLLLMSRGAFGKRAGQAPWYAYTTGMLGLLMVGAIGYAAPCIGAAKGFTLILASQFLLAALIDHYGLSGALARPLSVERALGLGVLLVGVWLVVR